MTVVNLQFDLLKQIDTEQDSGSNPDSSTKSTLRLTAIRCLCRDTDPDRVEDNVFLMGLNWESTGRVEKWRIRVRAPLTQETKVNANDNFAPVDYALAA